MSKIFKSLFLLLFLIPLQNIYSIDITKIEAEAYIRGEYSRGLVYSGEMQAIGILELDEKYSFKSGLSYGITADNTDFKFFTRAGIAPFKAPVNFDLLYLYNGLIEYSAHSHSILPFVSYTFISNNIERAGISLGCNFRFTSFFGEAPQFEALLSYSVYYYFLNNEMLRFSAIVRNFDDFYARNVAGYSLGLNLSVIINKNWTVINEIDIMQSGGDGFSTNFYGFSWRGGGKYSW